MTNSTQQTDRTARQKEIIKDIGRKISLLDSDDEVIRVEVNNIYVSLAIVYEHLEQPK